MSMIPTEELSSSGSTSFSTFKDLWPTKPGSEYGHCFMFYRLSKIILAKVIPRVFDPQSFVPHLCFGPGLMGMHN